MTLERHIFEFIGETPLQLPMVTPAQQLAEKLHALVRTYDGELSSRVKDLFDMLVIADYVHLPSAVALVGAARQTFRVRDATWPPHLTHPPGDWTEPWQGFASEYPTRWTDVTIGLRCPASVLGTTIRRALNRRALEPSTVAMDPTLDHA